MPHRTVIGRRNDEFPVGRERQRANLLKVSEVLGVTLSELVSGLEQGEGVLKSKRSPARRKEAVSRSGVSLELQKLMKRLRVQGFIVLDYAEKYMEAATQLGKWKMFGKLKDRETIVEGLEKAPDAINMLFTGGNIGKLLVKV